MPVTIDGEGLTQWDSDRRIIITGLESVTDAEVHFASAADNHAYVILPYTESSTVYANIPNILLTQYYTIRVYVYQSNRTISSVDFPIAVRPKPDDYVYTPTEVFDYRQLAADIAAKISCTDATVGSYGYTKNVGTITGIIMNGESKGTSGVVNLGTVLTAHQDISGKQNVIADLAAIRAGAALGATALQSVPATYRTASAQDSIDTAISNNITAISGKIPTQATSVNQLADKAFVNSSISTATATFRGTFSAISDLPTTGVDDNDYAFVVSTDIAGNTVYNRYKYASDTWTFEYALNNSSFTAAQWTAIQSGITAESVAKLNGITAETWTFTLADNTTVTKTVMVGG